MNRRDCLAGLAALAALPLKSAENIEHVETLFHHAAPDMSLDGASILVAEVSYEPGGASARHHHNGFIVAYVLEGAIVSQVEGQPEQTYGAGQVFYEPPGGVHAVCRNASDTKRARLLTVYLQSKTKVPA